MEIQGGVFSCGLGQGLVFKERILLRNKLYIVSDSMMHSKKRSLYYQEARMFLCVTRS